jgi:hypothetical protein
VTVLGNEQVGYWYTRYALVRIVAVVVVVGSRIWVVVVDRAMAAHLQMSGVKVSLG